jgi:hypothetical protein
LISSMRKDIASARTKESNMPYIKKEDRKVFSPIIKKFIGEALAEKDPIARVELVGDFLKSTILGYAHYALGITNPMASKQNSQIILSLIRTKHRISDYFEVAGTLNYIASAVIWGVEGEAEGADRAKYGFRSMMKAVLIEIMEDIAKLPSGGSIANRLRTVRMLRGMVSDVIDENYRRRTAAYEDQKIVENGDLWPLEE